MIVELFIAFQTVEVKHVHTRITHSLFVCFFRPVSPALLQRIACVHI